MVIKLYKGDEVCIADKDQVDFMVSVGWSKEPPKKKDAEKKKRPRKLAKSE